MNTSHNISTIIFDFGGVLLDWDPRYLYKNLFDGDDDALERFLSEVKFIEWNKKQDAGRSFDEAVAELSASFPHYSEAIQAYHERYLESISGPVEGTVEILKRVKELGYSICGLSNWPYEKYLMVKEKYPFFNWFDQVVISGDVRLVKPDPRIFQLLLDRIGKRAEECLLIDDSTTNIEAANRLRFKTIHFVSGEQLREQLVKSGISL